MNEAMKDSGTLHLGVIPDLWSAKKIKYCADICNGSEYKDIELDEGGYPVIGSGGEFARASQYSYSGKSVLLGRKGTVDKPLFIDDAFWCVDTMFYTKMKPITYAKYLYYCSLNIRFDYYMTSTALPSMTQRDLGSEKIALPKIHEQILIANFLDEQCGKIDDIATDLEKQIDILQKYKKSLITETVTKGLDRSAPMKDSGIEWLGEIPAHWKVRRIKYSSYMQTGTTPPLNEGINYEKDGVSWFTPSDFIEGSINLEQAGKYISYSSINFNSIKIFPENSVLFIGIASVGKIGFCPSYSYSNQQITAVKPNNIIIGKFLAYSVLASIDFIKDNALYTTVPIVNNAYLGNVKIVIPKKDEQSQIVDFLDNQCTQIDSIIESKKVQLSKLQQHKKSLIYEYVTGKKRVKGVNENGN